MIIFAVSFLPVAIAVAAFVIDIANAFEHRRHLQLQADAGVLAAAQEFSHCFLDENGANAAIEAQAVAYSGAAHNAQIGQPDAQTRVTTRINASNWTADSYTDGEPCDTGFVDLKLTEGESPPFFPFVGNHDYKAHARVQVFKIQSSKKLLPIAVPDPSPQSGRVTFIDETTGLTLASAALSSTGTSGGLSNWENAPLDVPITAEHVGVRVALGGATSTTCGDPIVNCFDSGSTHGIMHIRGWTADGTAAAKSPIARRVELLKGTCSDAYFSNANAACAIGVDATVDFGSAPVALGATVDATVGNQSYPLTFSAGKWTSAAVIPVGPHTGPTEIGLHWTIARNADGTRCNGSTCRGDIPPVQRTFTATEDRSGQIQTAQVAEGGLAPANSFQRCGTTFTSCTHSLVVKIGVKGPLGLSGETDPPVRLRVIGGSQNQSLDCDPNVSKLKDELAFGCAPAYKRNTGTACPGSPGTLWSDPNPPAIWDCVATQTGNATNQVAEGLNKRILGAPSPSTCTSPNHWPDYPPGDPRIVFVIVTPFGSFNGSGNTTVPVVRFAAFYVTGWTGQGSGFDNPCLGNGDEMPTNPAEIVGRFIQYVETPNEGGAGGSTCDFSALDPCIAVMTE